MPNKQNLRSKSNCVVHIIILSYQKTFNRILLLTKSKIIGTNPPAIPLAVNSFASIKIVPLPAMQITAADICVTSFSLHTFINSSGNFHLLSATTACAYNPHDITSNSIYHLSQNKNHYLSVITNEYIAHYLHY